MPDGRRGRRCAEGGDPPCWSHLFEDRDDIADRDDIEVLVRNFYRDAAMDDLLGPVFEAARVNWNAHIATLIDFWAWQLLGEPGYDGHPLRAHEPVHARTPFAHSFYERWVELFCGTVDASFRGPRRRGRQGARTQDGVGDGTPAVRRVGEWWRADRTGVAARRRVLIGPRRSGSGRRGVAHPPPGERRVHGCGSSSPVSAPTARRMSASRSHPTELVSS